ncbi:DNA sulfur modification protein DndD [Rhodovibrio sodomensis]|uniref:DNA sulfur modification protein DndD n=1 Tax=Rhodovibrio sodomensis TaxID=1088 RepID=A0ABS1DJ70_9PROT|nr:DNA sulfur modification protein DndD [Rhodovibrio sodomensis]MBK1670046.1 DNA sulfur modification protein DndD [Rhodovibrio sodomensis]
MILDELTIHDFGIYGGRQTIRLTPPSAEQPVILFGGLNGGGKTTLLDALQLVLFGPFAKCSNRNGLSYQKFLANCIHRGTGAQEAALELTFRHTLDGQEGEYRLHRSWRLTSNGCKEHFEVLRDGRVDRTMTENWANQVEDFFPSNIAHLFLFDGEKVEGYASPESSANLIGTAIQNLLGLDIVDQLEKDLQTFERRKQVEAKGDEDRQAIEKAEQEIEEARQRLDQLKQDRASLETSRLEKARARLAKVEERYRKLGGELYDQRAEIEARRDAAEKAARDGSHRLRELAAGCLPLALCPDLLTAVSELADQEEESRHEREVLATLQERDVRLLELAREQGSDTDLLKRLEAFCEEDRARRQEISARASYLDLPTEAQGDLRALLNRDLKEAKEEARSQLTEQRRLEEELDQAQLEAASVPQPDSLSSVIEEREQLRTEISQLEAERARLEEEIARTERELEQKQQTLTRLLEADAQAELHRNDRARILHRSPKVRGTLETFRRAVVERHLRKIEQLVLESYQQLLRKTSLVTALSIDPNDFSLTLFAHDGERLSPERLSAGERQLLAVALLWGLAKASGRPLPTAIDTPLGRLDRGHRGHLVERYFPFASHQVLLLSTDEEITGDYLERLSPWIGRMYALDFDDAAGATRISEGYFPEKEAA